MMVMLVLLMEVETLEARWHDVYSQFYEVLSVDLKVIRKERRRTWW
jgi:hypothetical protein